MGGHQSTKANDLKTATTKEQSAVPLPSQVYNRQPWPRWASGLTHGLPPGEDKGLYRGEFILVQGQGRGLPIYNQISTRRVEEAYPKESHLFRRQFRSHMISLPAPTQDYLESLRRSGYRPHTHFLHSRDCGPVHLTVPQSRDLEVKSSKNLGDIMEEDDENIEQDDFTENEIHQHRNIENTVETIFNFNKQMNSTSMNERGDVSFRENLSNQSENMETDGKQANNFAKRNSNSLQYQDKRGAIIYSGRNFTEKQLPNAKIYSNFNNPASRYTSHCPLPRPSIRGFKPSLTTIESRQNISDLSALNCNTESRSFDSCHSYAHVTRHNKWHENFSKVNGWKTLNAQNDADYSPPGTPNKDYSSPESGISDNEETDWFNTTLPHIKHQLNRSSLESNRNMSKSGRKSSSSDSVLKDFEYCSSFSSEDKIVSNKGSLSSNYYYKMFQNDEGERRISDSSTNSNGSDGSGVGVEQFGQYKKTEKSKSKKQRNKTKPSSRYYSNSTTKSSWLEKYMTLDELNVESPKALTNKPATNSRPSRSKTRMNNIRTEEILNFSDRKSRISNMKENESIFVPSNKPDIWSKLDASISNINNNNVTSETTIEESFNPTFQRAKIFCLEDEDQEENETSDTEATKLELNSTNRSKSIKSSRSVSHKSVAFADDTVEGNSTLKMANTRSMSLADVMNQSLSADTFPKHGAFQRSKSSPAESVTAISIECKKEEIEFKASLDENEVDTSESESEIISSGDESITSSKADSVEMKTKTKKYERSKSADSILTNSKCTENIKRLQNILIKQALPFAFPDPLIVGEPRLGILQKRRLSRSEINLNEEETKNESGENEKLTNQKDVLNKTAPLSTTKQGGKSKLRRRNTTANLLSERKDDDEFCHSNKTKKEDGLSTEKKGLSKPQIIPPPPPLPPPPAPPPTTCAPIQAQHLHGAKLTRSKSERPRKKSNKNRKSSQQ